jgi:opacity protein-like surface antigen
LQKIGGVILCVLAINGLAKADNSFSEIDLTSFQDIPSIIDACDAPIQNVGYSNGQNSRRFYITGLWGVSASNLTDVDDTTGFENGSANIFTAGIAGGISFERDNGRLRLETEWLQRDYFKSRQDAQSFLVATSNWSVLANVWRDFMFTNRFGCYGGGGLGGGGIQVGEIFQPNPVDYASPSTAFAWQAGGGLIYELSDRVTFDVSYRWYQLGNFQIIDRTANENWQFSASQVMFSLRVFEPFGFLRR